MIPTQQGFECADFVRGKVHDGLVEEFELVGDEGLAQIELQGPASLHFRIHLGLEEPVQPAPVGLCAIEREVCGLQEAFALLAVPGSKGDADARADHHLVAIEVEGTGEGGDDALGENDGAARLLGRDRHDGKLVSPQSGDDVRLPGALAQALGNHLEELVADWMAERVVNFLEQVEVDAQQGQILAAPPSPRELLPKVLLEQHPVRQPGERVVPGHVQKLRLQALALLEVL